MLECSRGASFDRVILLRIYAESQVSSKWKNMVQDEEAAFKGSDLGSARTVQVLSALHFLPCVVVVHDPVLHSCFARHHLSLVLDI